jgi:hypothetical protein
MRAVKVFRGKSERNSTQAIAAYPEKFNVEVIPTALSIGIGKGLCRNFGAVHAAIGINLARSRSILARPYICRLRDVSRQMVPSVCPFDHGDVIAAVTAA